MLRTITGNIDSDAFGVSLFSAGDANGDGALDFLVDASGHDAGGDGAGRVYLIAGDIFPSVSAPPIAAASRGFQLVGVRPNPTPAHAEILFRVPHSTPVRLTIHDVTGRSVRTLLDGTVGPGAHALAWDGRDAAGRRVASGIWFVRLETSRGTVGTRVVRIR